MGESIELVAIAKALRKILTEIREDIGAAETTLVEYEGRHGVTSGALLP